jgi:hypothetical protein
MTTGGFTNGVAMADTVRALALVEEEKQHALSAAYHYQRDCMHYQMAERFRTSKGCDRAIPNATVE